MAHIIQILYFNIYQTQQNRWSLIEIQKEEKENILYIGTIISLHSNFLFSTHYSFHYNLKTWPPNHCSQTLTLWTRTAGIPPRTRSILVPNGRNTGRWQSPEKGPSSYSIASQKSHMTSFNHVILPVIARRFSINLLTFFFQ